MIIQCIKCNKTFKVNASLIPNNGRKLQCGSCNYTWFYNPHTNEEVAQHENINFENLNEENSSNNVDPIKENQFNHNQVKMIIEEEMSNKEELIENNNINSGIYNLADDRPLSTNEIIRLISKSQKKKILILNISKKLIKFLSKIGDKTNFPLNSMRLKKLTESYVVSNKKIVNQIGKSLPISSEQGMLKTFNSFKLFK